MLEEITQSYKNAQSAIELFNASEENISNTFYLICIIIFIVFAILSLFILSLPNASKVNLSLLVIIVFICIYLFESYLFLTPKKSLIKSRIEASKQMEISYDMRNIIEVLDDLNNSATENERAYPNVVPKLFKETDGLVSKKGKIFPLGGISNVTTVYCNENGYWSIIKADEHGFHNINGLYKEYFLDIVLTGDSFTQGACVKPEENIAAVLRENGFKALSLGVGGNGPLIELAAIKEYAEILKPKIVLWLYNDFHGRLETEMNSSILRRYLYEDNFSQNLINRQNEIDDILINYVQEKRKIGEKQNNNKSIKEQILTHWLFRILVLTNFRVLIDFEAKPKVPETFKTILDKSNKIVTKWGGQLYFVYLPVFETNLSLGQNYRKDILDIVTKLNIPIIDIKTEVFDNHKDPLSFFPFRMNGHYNAKGYRHVAEAISKRLIKDEIISIKIHK